MRIYLDNCALNRPFDDQRHIRIRIETEAKLYLQEKIKKSEIELIWSYILELENDQNPFEEKRLAIEKWEELSIVNIDETESIIKRADDFVLLGVKAKDALHVSSAIEGKADYFITTDDRLLKKLYGRDEIQALNPVDIVGEIDERNN
jgi:predicted nucleic acid-binding protein